MNSYEFLRLRLLSVPAGHSLAPKGGGRLAEMGEQLLEGEKGSWTEKGEQQMERE